MPRRTKNQTNKNTYEKQKAAQIAQETIEALERGWYLLDSARDSARDSVSIREIVDHAVENTVLYTPKDLSDEFIASAISTCKQESAHLDDFLGVTVKNQTTLEATQELVAAENYKNVCALNFASAKNPGGGFLKGARAQEESIARSSAIYPCLTSEQAKEFYESNHKDKTCLYTHHIIYSPKVPVIRSDEGEWLDPLYCASFISAPAPNAGVAKNRSGAGDIKNTLHDRIRFVLAIAASNKCDALVLGAFGCGVFKNDPAMVANIFNHLFNNEFQGCFKRIVFAIPSIGPSSNITPFTRLFPGE